jgi:hypothetical protein
MNSEPDWKDGWKALSRDLWWFLFLLAEDLQSLENYLEVVAKALVAEQKRRLDDLKTAYVGPPENEHLVDEIRGHLAFELEHSFPYYLWSSTFVALMSFVEARIFALCDELQKRLQLKLRHQDLRGDGLRRASDFIEKVCDLPFQRRKETWDELMTMGKIRNVIIHRGGDIGPNAEAQNDDRAIWTYIEKNASKGISTNEGNCLRLGQDFCKHALAVIYKFFDEVLAGVSRR